MSTPSGPGATTLTADMAGRLHDQYEQICTSYHAIEDLRSKLLGFLPIASAGGIFFLLADPFTTPDKLKVITPYLGPIGLLGSLITVGLFLYDLRENQLGNALRKNAQDIEHLLGLQWQGQFSMRPQGKMHVINSGVAVSLIYAAVLSGWVFLGLIPAALPNAPQIGAAVILGGFLLALFVRLALYYGLPQRGVPTRPQMNHLIPVDQLPEQLKALWPEPVESVIIEQHQGKLVLRPALPAKAPISVN